MSEAAERAQVEIVVLTREIRYKAGPRLRDLASWPPLAAGASSRNLGPIL